MEIIIKLPASNAFSRFMAENGYETITTFWNDFTAADMYGPRAVRGTFRRAFKEWKKDYKHLTELVMVLNHKIGQHFEKNRPLAQVYHDLWLEAASWAEGHLEGKELQYYYRTTD